MKTKTGVQARTMIASAFEMAPNTGREDSANAERMWESFPQPAGWAVRWDNEGLLYADAPIADTTADKG